MRYLLILFMLLLVLFPVQAQTNWHFVLYIEQEETATYTAELQVYTLNGLQERVPLPEALGLPNSSYSYGAMVSDDLRFVALYQTLNDEFASASLRIYDRQTGNCCIDIADSIEDVIAFSFAGFSPDGSSLAFSYIKRTFPEPDSGGIMIVDSTRGLISEDIPMSIIKEHVDTNDSDTWALMGDWTTQGIYFVPFCYACDAFLNQEYSLYDPATKTFNANSGVFPGERLSITGELVYTEHNRRYSYDMSYGLFPASNVVKYSPSGFPSSVAPVIFASENLVNIRDIDWVADGNAILVEASPDMGLWELLWRDGRRQEIGIYGLSLRGGTPSGWLASKEKSDGTEMLLHYDAQTLEAKEITSIEADFTYRIIQKDPLGQTLNPIAFVTVPPPARPVAHCKGFLPSRLVIGDIAQVMPGTANRLRAQPINGDVIGQIPAGAEFEVFGESFCDDFEGILWWEVNYQGQVGWTAEGQGDEYWVEPVGA